MASRGHSCRSMCASCACCVALAATIAVITNDGRSIVGILRGYDQATNIILDECHERVYSMQVSARVPQKPVTDDSLM